MYSYQLKTIWVLVCKEVIRKIKVTLEFKKSFCNNEPKRILVSKVYFISIFSPLNH